MIFNTRKIDDLSNKFFEGQSVKSVLRDISIDNLFDENSEKVDFPFLSKGDSVDVNYRQPNILFELSDSEMKDIIRIENDPLYLYKMISSNISVLLDKCDIISEVFKSRFSIVRSIRGCGNTFLSSFLAYHSSLCDKTILIISNNIKQVSDNIRMFYELTPFYMKCGVIRDGYNKWEFDNGSHIKIINNMELGSNYDVIIIDDCHHNKDLYKIYIIQTSLKSGKMIFFTSENGLDYNDDMYQLFNKIDTVSLLRNFKVNELLDDRQFNIV